MWDCKIAKKVKDVKQIKTNLLRGSNLEEGEHMTEEVTDTLGGRISLFAFEATEQDDRGFLTGITRKREDQMKPERK